MAESTLNQVQRLVDQLSPDDLAHLRAYLAVRVSQAVASAPPNAPLTAQGTSEAWDDFFRLGEALAAGDTPGSATLTAAVLAMRR